MSEKQPNCPECGSPWVRTGPYYAILGELSDMRFTEATDKYYQNREDYDNRPVQVFTCGNTKIDT